MQRCTTIFGSSKPFLKELFLSYFLIVYWSRFCRCCFLCNHTTWQNTLRTFILKSVHKAICYNKATLGYSCGIHFRFICAHFTLILRECSLISAIPHLLLISLMPVVSCLYLSYTLHAEISSMLGTKRGVNER